MGKSIKTYTNKDFMKEIEKSRIINNPALNAKAKKAKTKNQKRYLNILNRVTGANVNKIVFPDRITTELLESMEYASEDFIRNGNINIAPEKEYYHGVIRNFVETFTDGWNYAVSGRIADIVERIKNEVGSRALATAILNFSYDLAYFFQNSVGYDSDAAFEMFEAHLLKEIPFITEDDLSDLELEFDEDIGGVPF